MADALSIQGVEARILRENWVVSGRNRSFDGEKGKRESGCRCLAKFEGFDA
jgi:hypothetical protein